MGVNVTNLIQGPATMYHGWFGSTTEPGNTDINTAPSVSGHGMTDVGGTLDGVTLNVAIEWSELAVDQIVDVPGRRMTKRDMSVATQMAEGTIENLTRSLNGGTSATGTGWKSYEPAMANSAVTPNYGVILLDGIADNSRRRRVIARKTLQTENTESAYKKDEQWVIPGTFSTHYVSESIPPFKITDATS